MSAPAVIVSITESLPARISSGTLAIVYAFAISVFGGSTQFSIQWLIETTGNPIAPAYYMMAAVMIGLVAMTFMRESAPAKIAVTAKA
jgi:hypothetical protein